MKQLWKAIYLAAWHSRFPADVFHVIATPELGDVIHAAGPFTTTRTGRCGQSTAVGGHFLTTAVELVTCQPCRDRLRRRI